MGKHFTVNQMVAKESVRARFERPDQGISYTEFSYMLLQAYDFLRLYDDHGCQLQVGGSDQWGNITMGVELIRKVARGEAFGLTTPLVTKADGTKFGKTESGTVWLDPAMTSPYRFYQFLLHTEDAVVGAYLRYFTFLSHDEIAALDQETAAHPERRAAQRTLAREVCHAGARHRRGGPGRAGLGRALRRGDRQPWTRRPCSTWWTTRPSSSASRQALLDRGPVRWSTRWCRSGLATSKGEARRTIAQGGAYVNNRREDDDARVLGPDDLLHDRYVVLRRGRRDYHLLRVG